MTNTYAYAKTSYSYGVQSRVTNGLSFLPLALGNKLEASEVGRASVQSTVYRIFAPASPDVLRSMLMIFFMTCALFANVNVRNSALCPVAGADSITR